jgi:hypothetical protein
MSVDKPSSAEDLEAAVLRGEDVSHQFGKGRMMQPKAQVERRPQGTSDIQKVNVDFTRSMLSELDLLAKLLNVSRQSVIKSFVKDGLDRHFQAMQARAAAGGRGE